MNFLKPNWPAPTHIKAYTTLRHAWGENIYSQPQTVFIFDLRQSKALCHLLNLPNEPIWLKQTHSTIVLEATPENKGSNADASYTSEVNRVCMILTADCLPILLCNQQGTHVAAIHAGWRGLAGGIIEKTLDLMSLPPEDLLIWLGPAIGPQKFEVGPDVFDAFMQKDPSSEQAFVSLQEGKWFANLYDLARIYLNKQGIKQIYGGEYCTHTQSDLFFSYRRDGKQGRMASLIWIEKN